MPVTKWPPAIENAMNRASIRVCLIYESIPRLDKVDWLGLTPKVLLCNVSKPRYLNSTTWSATCYLKYAIGSTPSSRGGVDEDGFVELQRHPGPYRVF